ncbi:MAG: type II toxin-antitoxin system RelE/ParE family toxin [Geminicoccaceae bacterium]
MIKSFADRRTARIFRGAWVQDVHPELQRRARARLRELDVATDLDDLALRPGNRLEKLIDNRRGQWSIRVSVQWRVCFSWNGGDAFDIWFGDYH